MKLSDGFGVKAPRWIANEMVVSSDLNTIHEVTYKNLVDALASMYAPAQATSSSSDIIAGEGLRMIWDAAMTAKIQPGAAVSFTGTYFNGSTWGFVSESGSVFGVFVGAIASVAIDTGSASDRYDTIEVRPIQTEYSSQSRKFRDPITGVITTTSMNTRIEYGYELQVLKGTSGGGAAPAHTAGWIKICEVYVPAGATFLAQSNFRQVEATNNWTTEATTTIRKTFKNFLTEFPDYPDSYTGMARKPLVVNAAETAVQFGLAIVSITTNSNLTNGCTHHVSGGSRLDVTLPTAAAVGDIIEVTDIGGNGWKIKQNASQNIRYNTSVTTTGTGGYIRSGDSYATVVLICTVANTTWQTISVRDSGLTGA